MQVQAADTDSIWLLGWLTNSLGAIVICLIGAVIIAIHECVSQTRLRSHMRSIGFPATYKWRFLSPIPSLRQEMRARATGGTWLLGRMQFGILYASSVIFFLGVARSFLTELQTEFQRIGAIIVVMGLLSTIAGLRESREIRLRWNEIEKSADTAISRADIQRYIEYPISRANIRYNRISIAISILGTIIWAYGDQILGCWMFPGYFTAQVCDLAAST